MPNSTVFDKTTLFSVGSGLLSFNTLPAHPQFAFVAFRSPQTGFTKLVSNSLSAIGIGSGLKPSTLI